jgi:hypothetical protein
MQKQSASKLPRMAILVMMACALLSINCSMWAASDDGREGGAKCSNRTLQGTYGLTIEGLLAIPGPGIQVRGVVLQGFDGNGHITQVDHVVIDGMPPTEAWRPGAGTYHIRADCTGKATITIASSQQPPLVVFFVVTNDGKEIRQVVEGNAVVATGRRVD